MAENKALDWEDLEKPAHRQMQNYTKALIQLYKTHPALWKLDYDPMDLNGSTAWNGKRVW